MSTRLHDCYESGYRVAMDKVASSGIGRYLAKKVGGKGATPKSLSKKDLRSSSMTSDYPSYSYQNSKELLNLVPAKEQVSIIRKLNGPRPTPSLVG